MNTEPIVLRAWNSAEHLKTDEDMAAYLDACREEGDPALIAHALGVIGRACQTIHSGNDEHPAVED